MNKCLCLALLVCGVLNSQSQSQQTATRLESEYYVAAYARHYNVPIPFVRAIVEQESSWRPCAVSSKGAAGLMQLMPMTAVRLGVRDRCKVDENVSGGVRYLAWLMHKFQGDPRLVAAAYLAGEELLPAAVSPTATARLSPMCLKSEVVTSGCLRRTAGSFHHNQ